ncbi:MAG: Type I Iterative PKS [Bogoriella megaspora]|nr:MAG: Type I Iterative PKS [Bogoriella megaspora]
MTTNEPIAIVGSGCRFAGNINSPSKLWELLREPRDVRQEIPLDRFSAQGFHHPNGAYHGHSNVQHAYLLEDDPSRFDTEFFGIKPIEAKSMDPQQRLLMECSYEAIEAAGMTIAGLSGSDTAVFAGLMTNDYGMMLTRDLAQVPVYHATGISSAIVSNRISYFFDWHGPSMTVDTGCSASLVALHLAVQSLRGGECRMALACGANLILGPEYFVIESKLKMLSPDGRSKMWDQDANGYARGDGIAAVALKTLSAALADGDHIECIIRETGTNQDGSTSGITVPSAIAQETLIRSTYAKAGLDLQIQGDRPQYFEAHGTGTPVGDPIEAEAIHNALFKNDSGSSNGKALVNCPLYVGSIKTVLGHTEGSAGIAAVLKTSLALQNATIPPNLLLDQISDRVAPFYGNLEIAQSAKPWPEIAQGQVRRASVNSFGFGGTNVHVILESYEKFHCNGDSCGRFPLFTPFVFSASSEKVLKATLSAHAAHFSNASAIDPRDLAWTLRQRRALLPCRVSVTASSITNLASKILTLLHQDDTGMGLKALPVPQSGGTHGILGVFTGQGAQYARMGAELIEESPTARVIIEKLELMLAELPVGDRPTWSLQAELLANATSSRVHEATISQPLCTAVQIMIVDLLRLAKVEFAAVVGHSSGEIAAAYAANFLTARETMFVAYYRGMHLRSAISPQGAKIRGAMLAVGSSMECMSELCATERFAGRFSVAASNSHSSVTVSGDEDAIAELQGMLNSEKKFNRRLKVDKAYHSVHMIPCFDPYLESLKTCVRTQQVQVPTKSCLWFSSVYDKLIDPHLGVSAAYWAENMVKPVLFSQALTRTSVETKFEIALEVGAHPALTGPASQTIGDALPSNPKAIPYFGTLSRDASAIEALSTCLGDLWSRLSHNEISLDSYERAMCGRNEKFSVVKDLPSYPWDHSTSYWHEARASRKMRSRKQRVHSLLGDVTTDSTTHHLSWRNLLRVKEMEWLSGHEIQGQAVFPAAGYICTALEASCLLAARQNILLIELQDFVIHQAIVLPEDDAGVEVLTELVDISTARKGCMEAKFTYSAAVGANVEDLTLVASANVVVKLGNPSTSLLPQSSTGLKLTHASNVVTESFYSALANIGYNFSGRFCSLSHLTRKHRKSSSSLRVGTSNAEGDSLLLHPAEFDAAFQAILLAYSYPNDGQLRRLHLPTAIRHIRVNPALCNSWDTKEDQFIPIEAVLIPKVGGEGGIVGDVNFYSNNSANAMIQIQGAKLVPLGGVASEVDDRCLFSMVHWINNELDGSGHTIVSQYQRDIMKMLERISTFYLREFDRQLSLDHPARSERPLSFYLDRAQRTAPLVENGDHGWATEAWKDDTLESVMSASSEFSDVPDVRLVHLVGKHMPCVFKGETTMYEEFRGANLLSEYYTNGVVIQASASWIIGMLKQIVDRFPHMDIMEIGAGAGEGVTQRFPRGIGHTFASYTYANISNSIQKDGTAFFSQPSDPKPVRILDPELDPSSQGYVKGSYHLIIAFWVVHATRDSESALRNLRRLLKPGGYLIISEGAYNDSGGDGGLQFIFGTLPGWWLSIDQGRTLSPYLSPVEWDRLLRTTGFSGIDTAPPKEFAETFGVSVFVSQAVDDNVRFLRDPIGMPHLGSPIQKLVVVGGLTDRSSHFVKGLENLPSHSFGNIHHFETLEDVDHSIITPQTTVVSLTELDKPVFRDMNATTFPAFKRMFETGKNLLWVTSGRLENQPFSNLALGFGKTALVETPDLRLQQLDLADPQATNPMVLAKKILQFASVVLETVVWTVESELVVDAEGHELIPRLKPISTLNDRYISSVREVKQPVITEESAVTLDINENSCTAELIPHGVTNLTKPLLELRTVYTIATAIKTTIGYKFLVLCRDASTGATYLALLPQLASIYRLPVTSVILCSTTQSCEAAFLSLLAAHLISIALFDKVYGDQRIVVHNATEPMASAIKKQASTKGFKFVSTADSTNLAAVGSSLKLAPYLTQYELNQTFAENVSFFVGLSVSDAQRGDNEAAIMSYLPPYCHKETASTIFARQGTPWSGATADVLRSALRNMAEDDLDGLQRARFGTDLMDVGRLLQGTHPPNQLAIIDWTICTSIPATIAGLDTQQLFRCNKTYWIIGLSAALGASLFDWMIERGARHLVFTSRKPHLDPAWIETHKRNGINVAVIACDITDEAALESTHAAICANMAPIAGVVNGAAVFRDTSIAKMSFGQLNDVLQPKVHGTLYLDRIFYDQHLDFFILTSSITGLLGSAGQANYAAANTFMCGIAAQRRKRGLAATAINLGAIAGIGLLERGNGKVFDSIIQRLSLMPISERDFHQIFAAAIEAGRPNYNFCGPELTTALRKIPVDTSNAPAFYSDPMFSHFLLVGADQQRTMKAKLAKSIKELLATCETEDELQSIVKGAFSNEIRKTLQTTTADDDLMTMRSADLGIDSLVSIDLRTWFTKNLKVNMPVLKIMSNDTLENLVLFAVENVPSELLPSIASRAASKTSMNENSVHASISKTDWDAETCPPADLAALAMTSEGATTAVLDPSTVLLTGASGLLGHHILKALLEQLSIKKVICIGVRRLEEKLDKGELLNDDRVVYYAGELSQPRLGLSVEDAISIFAQVGAVIHNGADTSHLKSYFDLRPANVGSTIELIRLCLPRRIPLHVVSSNAVGRYSNKAEIGEVPINSPGAPKPPTDGSSGYRSTKWAMEGLLERLYESYKLPIWIHRPSTIIRTGTDAEGLAAELDWMNALILYMDKLSAVPKLNHVDGFLDLVHAQTVCTGIVGSLLKGEPAGGAGKVLYVHHMGDLLLPLARLEDISKGSGRAFRQLPREEWIAEAVAAGMHAAVVVLIEMMDAPGLKGPPRFVKGAGSPD